MYANATRSIARATLPSTPVALVRFDFGSPLPIPVMTGREFLGHPASAVMARMSSLSGRLKSVGEHLSSLVGRLKFISPRL